MNGSRRWNHMGVKATPIEAKPHYKVGGVYHDEQGRLFTVVALKKGVALTRPTRLDEITSAIVAG